MMKVYLLLHTCCSDHEHVTVIKVFAKHEHAEIALREINATKNAYDTYFISEHDVVENYKANNIVTFTKRKTK